MKKLIFAAVMVFTTGTATAQNQTYKIEVTDNTEMQILSAQYSILQQEKRRLMAEQFYKVARGKYLKAYEFLNMAAGRTIDRNILQRISEAHRQNLRLSNIKNVNRYNKELRKLETEIGQIYLLTK